MFHRVMVAGCTETRSPFTVMHDVEFWWVLSVRWLLFELGSGSGSPPLLDLLEDGGEGEIENLDLVPLGGDGVVCHGPV